MELLGQRFRPLLCLGLLALLAGPAAPFAQARAVPAKAAKDKRKTWDLSEFTWIRLVPKEAGAPANHHPAALDFALLSARLGSIKVDLPGGTEPLFGPDELNDLRKPLCQAFAAAGPDEDLILMSTNRRGGGVLQEPLAITARLFWQDDRLNLILHDARLAFFINYRISGHKPDFLFGSRATAGDVQLQCPRAASPRPDWLVMDMTPDAPVPAPAPVAAAPMPEPAAVPAPALLLVPAAAAPAPAASAAVARDAAWYKEREQRLRGLKALRDEGLITEEEYQKKHRAIIDEL